MLYGWENAHFWRSHSLQNHFLPALTLFYHQRSPWRVDTNGEAAIWNQLQNQILVNQFLNTSSTFSLYVDNTIPCIRQHSMYAYSYNLMGVLKSPSKILVHRTSFGNQFSAQIVKKCSGCYGSLPMVAFLVDSLPQNKASIFFWLYHHLHPMYQKMPSYNPLTWYAAQPLPVLERTSPKLHPTTQPVMQSSRHVLHHLAVSGCLLIIPPYHDQNAHPLPHKASSID